ncbi:MAG TPA: zinc-dependent alcohol dehydrogenase family protein, partial [Chryseolinea sp.]|nr:zinc-dependent alcohol dehydrogenase family protein [Chryseolinea sp.]
LTFGDIPTPVPKEDEIRIKIRCCGVCRTDLHIIEGDIPRGKLPIIPGHQVIGRIESVGSKVKKHKIDGRVGVAWLYSSCGSCKFCRNNLENLCLDAHFTGYDRNGGYAEYTVVNENFAYPVPENFSDTDAAPLLCAGTIGYRSLKLAQMTRGGTLGLVGFGASAHLVIQVSRHQGLDVFVFTRDTNKGRLAKDLGAAWVGDLQSQPPKKLDAIIIFAPIGETVPASLPHLDRGGRLIINTIHMTPIPKIDYRDLWHEKMIKSVANVTRADVHEFLQLAAKIPIKPRIEVFPFEKVNEALLKLKQRKLIGSAVLKM